MKMYTFKHVQSHSGWIDMNQILHTDSLIECSDIFGTVSKFVWEIWRGDVRNLAYANDFGIGF